jgi:hypothetical protein
MAKGAGKDRHAAGTGYEGHSDAHLAHSLQWAKASMERAQGRIARIKREMKRRARRD